MGAIRFYQGAVYENITVVGATLLHDGAVIKFLRWLEGMATSLSYKKRTACSSIPTGEAFIGSERYVQIAYPRRRQHR